MSTIDPIGGLDDPCAACGREVGDHTMREWNACMGDSWENPYRDLRGSERGDKVAGDLRDRFGLDPDWLVADTLQAKSLVIESAVQAQVAKLPGVTLSRGNSPMNVVIPAVLHEFQMSLPDGPASVVKVLYSAGTEDVMRAYGRLVRDTANGAANAAERRKGLRR